MTDHDGEAVLETAAPNDADFDDAGRDFHGLDARGAQAALAQELMGDEDAAAEEAAEKKTPEDAAAEEGAPEAEQEAEEDAPEAEAPAPTEWSDEDLAEHERMAEALLFAAAEALDEKTIADRLPAGADVGGALARLAAHYEARGVTLRKIDKKWRFVTASDVAHVLEKEQVTPRKLSRAALETLAIIAYHQPCTRADIEDVRGVQVAKGSLDQLLEIGWVRLRGKRRDAPGRPTLYGTTQSFLEHFGLESVQDLPGLADLKAAGLLDARLPPGFSVPSPADAEDEEADDEADETEFAQDFMDVEDGAEDGPQDGPEADPEDD